MTLLSTWITREDEAVSRNTKTKSVYSKVTIPRPTVIGTYNASMGGTDMADQKIEYYRIKFNTLHWKRKIYANMLNVIAFNSHVLYKDYHKLSKRGDKEARRHINFSLLDYIRTLIKQLAFPEQPDIDYALPTTAPRIGTPFVHVPLRIESALKNDTRRDCYVCGNRVQTMCKTCNKFLCFAQVKKKQKRAAGRNITL